MDKNCNFVHMKTVVERSNLFDKSPDIKTAMNSIWHHVYKKTDDPEYADLITRGFVIIHPLNKENRSIMLTDRLEERRNHARINEIREWREIRKLVGNDPVDALKHRLKDAKQKYEAADRAVICSLSPDMAALREEALLKWQAEEDAIYEERTYLKWGGADKYEAAMRDKYNASMKEYDQTNAPPCLAYLMKTGFPQGSMNNALVSLGVYAKKKFPDYWEDELENYNNLYLGPGTPQEVRNVIRSLTKKDYFYKCSDQPLAEVCDKIECAKRKYGIGHTDTAEKQEASNPLINFVLSLDELIALNIPERENLVAPFLPAQSLAMIFAPRGLGKSWFCMELALSLADGRRFLSWDVPTARRALYVDGEMPTKTLKDRFMALSKGIPANLAILPSEVLWTEDSPINLNNRSDQARIISLLETMTEYGRMPELIIFDNLSSLSAGGDENSNSELDSLLRFLISLRHKGYAILLVHHSGKSGDQRGASRREDLLDTSIKLSAAKSDDGATQGAKFTIEFVKTRGERPDPDKLTVELITGQHGGLEWVQERQQTAPAYMAALSIIRDCKPNTQKAIAQALSVSEARVTAMLQQARKAGFLEDGRLVLTAKGIVVLAKYYPETPF